MNEDLAKTEELFWPEVEKDYKISLAGFAAKVKEYYKKKFGEKSPVKVFSFDSKGLPNSMSLTVAYGFQPYIASIRLEQSTDKIEDLLENLDGDLELKYQGIPFVQQEYPAPKAAYNIKNGLLYNIELKKDPLFKNLRQRIESLTPEEQILSKKAEEINSEYHFYDSNDTNNALIHMTCSIRSKDSRHHFIYSLSTASFQPIPESLYTNANNIFLLVSNKFIMTYRGRVSDFIG